MSLPDELLDVARRLAHLDPTRPRQAALRRAVSSAYYALFHLLTADAAELFVTAPKLGGAISRTLNHGDMKRVSQEFVSGKLPRTLATHAGNFLTTATAVKLKRVAQTFVELQEARHEADYNSTRRFTRADTVVLVDQVGQAFATWADIRKSDEASLYLGCLLLWDRWDKPPR